MSKQTKASDSTYRPDLVQGDTDALDFGLEHTADVELAKRLRQKPVVIDLVEYRNQNISEMAN